MKHNHSLKIGVMGSASGPQTQFKPAIEGAMKLGEEIGKRGYIFINGACPGLPDIAHKACKKSGGFTIGISPAFSEHEHEKEYKSPHDHDVVIYTGKGFMERDIINIRSADAVVFIGGGIGTLNELTIAYEEGRPLGILTGTDGISDHVPHIIEDLCKRKVAPNMVFNDDPVKLLDELEKAIEKYPLPIHEDGRVIDKPEARREEHEKEGCDETSSDDVSEAGSRG